MQPELNDYLPVLLTVILAGGLAVVFLVLSALIGKKAKSNPVKDSPYECGMRETDGNVAPGESASSLNSGSQS